MQVRTDNERLQRDNERFTRLIDSGEWGRGRVAELAQAGALSWETAYLSAHLTCKPSSATALKRGHAQAACCAWS